MLHLQYIQQHFRSAQWWEDPNRGHVPISWTMNPCAADLIPDVLEYLLATQTANDEFVCSTAGIGLQTPALFAKNNYANYRALYSEYMRVAAMGMRRVGLQTIHPGDTSNVPWTKGDFSEFSASVPGLVGVLGDYAPMQGVYSSNANFIMPGGVPVARALVAPGHGGITEQSAQKFAASVRAATPGDRPAFMHICLINWYNSPTVARQAMNLLGKDYVPLLPSQFFPLLKTVMEANPKK